jgi:hypothetical protein
VILLMYLTNQTATASKKSEQQQDAKNNAAL